MFSGRCAEMRAIAGDLQRLPLADRISIALTEYESRDFSLVDVNRRGCTKGATLAEWAAGRGTRREEIMAIGDNFNDLEMLEAAGLPVVMANAVEALKRPGWHVTLSNDEGGVAAAIHRFALGQDGL
jgi:hypothetical protein